jgi:hypothetical protein
MSDDTDKDSSSYEDVLEEARERFTRIQEDDGENRDNQRTDFEFVYVPGRQWSDAVRSRRKSWDEPCLEFDQLKQFVNAVVNDERQNKPAILVEPANGEASAEVAEILQGLIRAIEYDSNAEAAYDNGFQGAVVGGRGWWRVCTEYEPGASFNQKIVIRPILDHLSVYADLDYMQPDASDRNFVFVIEKMRKEDFEQKWPDCEPVSFDDRDDAWKEGKDVVIVADYYRRVCTLRTMVAMSDGAVGWKDEMPKPPPGVTEMRSREVETYTIEWYKIAGGEQVLEKYDCPGTIIPVIQTTGDDIILDGKRFYQGLVCKARDAQTMFNFGMTQQAIHLALTPKAPWVAPQEAIEDYQQIWKNANNESYSVLPYKHKDRDGQPIERPTRTQPSMPDAGWINWCTTMTQVMRSTIGMYENSLGMRSTEVSGKAILAREKQGDVGTFHYVDNQHRAIALTGRVIQSWIPTYYDSERIVHIMGSDGARRAVTLNQTAPHPYDPLQAIKLNDVTVGEYAVAIETGPGYATKRQETADKLTALVNSFPQLMQVAGDLVMKSLDVSDADEIAERFKFALPPPIQQAIAAKSQGGKPDPATMAKLAQAQQQMQQMQQAMQELGQENQQLKSGVQEVQMKIEAHKQEQLGKLKVDKDIADERMKLEIAAALDKHELAKQQAEQDATLARYKAELDARTKITVAEISANATVQASQISGAKTAVQ